MNIQSYVTEAVTQIFDAVIELRGRGLVAFGPHEIEFHIRSWSGDSVSFKFSPCGDPRQKDVQENVSA